MEYIWRHGVISVVIVVLCQKMTRNWQKITLAPTNVFILVHILCENPLGTNNGLNIRTIFLQIPLKKYIQSKILELYRTTIAIYTIMIVLCLSFKFAPVCMYINRIPQSYAQSKHEPIMQ